MATYPPTNSDVFTTRAEDGTPRRLATDGEVARLHSAAQAVQQADFPKLFDPSANPGQKLFHVSFDGTWNDRNKQEIDTNPAQLELLIKEKIGNSGQSIYETGVGSQGGVGGAFDGGINAGNAATAIVNDAYKQFVDQVIQWKQADQNVNIVVSIAGFSRGGAESLDFANRLQERGVPDPNNPGQYLIAPGEVKLGPILLYEPVDMSFGALNVSVPSSATSVLVLGAADEHRSQFPAVRVIDPDNPNDPRITRLELPGAHTDIGGGYDHGVGAYTLQIGWDYLAKSGVPLGDIPPEYMVGNAQWYVHDPSIDSFNNPIWDVIPSRQFQDHTNPPPDSEKIAFLYPEGSKRIDPQTLEVKAASHANDGEETSGSVDLPNGVDLASDQYTTVNSGLTDAGLGMNASQQQGVMQYLAGEGLGSLEVIPLSGSALLRNADGEIVGEITRADTGWATVVDAQGTSTYISPAGHALSGDQYALIDNQLAGLSLSTSQQQGLLQYLSDLGLGEISIVELPGGSVVVANGEGEVVGNIRHDSNGAVRYVDNNGDGVQLDANGNQEDLQYGQTQSTWTQTQAAFGALQSSLSFIQALEQGNDFSAIIAGVSTVNQLIAAGLPIPTELQGMADTLGTIGSGLGIISAGLNLADALSSGDPLSIIGAASNLGSQAANLWSAYQSGQAAVLFEMGDVAGAIDQAANAASSASAAGALGTVASAVGLIMAIEGGNPVQIVGAAMSTVASAMAMAGAACPPLAIAAVIVSIIGSLMGSDAPMLEGQAQAVWDDSGDTHVITTQDAEGGGATATRWMQSLVDGLQGQLASMLDADGEPLYELIPQRLPSIGYQYDPDGFNYASASGHLYLKWIDANGQEQTRYYDGAGNRNDGTGDTLISDFMKHAAEAVVPTWEGQTILSHYQQEIAQAQAKEAQAAALEEQAKAVLAGIPIDESGQAVQAYDESGQPIGDANEQFEKYQHLQDQISQLKAEAQQLRAEANHAAAVPREGAGLPQEAADGLTQSFTALTFDIAPANTTAPRILVDIDNDGYLERTDWVAGNQAMLAIDLNGDGVIGAGELLNLDPAVTLERNSLRWLDANGDGIVNAADPAFTALRLWIDANSDGQTQAASGTSAGELQSLSSAGITAIDFNSKPPRIIKADGTTTALTEQLLTGDVKGVAYMMTEGGLLEATEDGETVLYAINTREYDGQAEHTHGGDMDTDGAGEGESVEIDADDPRLLSTTAKTVANTSQRTDTTLAANDPRMGNGSAGTAQSGQAAGQQSGTIAAGSSQVRSSPIAFVPNGAGSASQELQQVTQEMIRNADNSLFGLSAEVAPLIAIGVAAGAVQWPTVASAATVEQTTSSSGTNSSASLLPESVFADTEIGSTNLGTGQGNTNTSLLNAVTMALDSLNLGTIPSTNTQSNIVGTLLPGSASGNAPTPYPSLVDVGGAGATGGSVDGSASLTDTPAERDNLNQTPTISVDAGSEVVIDYPRVIGEQIDGIEDIGLRFPEGMLLANDSTINAAAFPDQPLLRITAVGSPVHGQVALRTNATGGTEMVFLPEADYHGAAAFTYTVTDQFGLSSTATVNLMVAAVNDAPVVRNDAASGDEDNTLMFHAADLLANDSDVDSAVDGDVLRITRVGQAEHGQVFLDADGIIRFVPDQDYNGPAKFDYWVADRDTVDMIGNGGAGYEVSGTMQLTIIPVNDLPVATGEQIYSDEDFILDIAPALLLANDTDVDIATNGQVLSITAVGNAHHGSVQLLPDGTIRFTPELNYFGAASFSYTVDDGNGGQTIATTVVNLAPINDAPDVEGETLTFDEDNVQTIEQAALLANDTDVDNPHNDLSIIAVDNSTHGLVALNPDGSIRFVPDADYFGPASFTYTVADGAGGFTVGTAMLDILPVNDAPRLLGETATTDEDDTLHFEIAGLLDNDVDVDNPHSELQITGVGNANHGTVAMQNGEIVFTPDLNYFGQASFTYTVADGVGGISQAQVNITLNSVNDAPVVNNEFFNGKRNITYTLTQAALLANDTDVENPGSLSVVGVQNAVHGAATLNANGSITFAPEAGYAGVGSFEYLVRDPDGAVVVGRTEIDFSHVNVNPVAVDDSFVGFEDTAFIISSAQLTANDSDPDRSGLSTMTVDMVANAAHGTVSLQADGSVRFMPAQNFYGTASFQYRVNDGEGGSTWATAYLNVQSVNDVPIVEDIWYGRPIYGYQWVATYSGYDEYGTPYVTYDEYGYSTAGWHLVPVTDEATAMALVSNPYDQISSDQNIIGSKPNDLMDANGNPVGMRTYMNGHLRPIAFNYADALMDGERDAYGEYGPSIPVDDAYRQNGKVIAYDPDGDSNALTFSISSSPQHGHAWANEYTSSSAPTQWDHLQTGFSGYSYTVYETAAWQYDSHRGDPYTGSDPFSVRVTDSGGASVDVMIQTSHVGSSAGGGGKCPIVVDLDGDGVELIRPEDSHILADVNDDGWRERIGWSSLDDGILAYDVNHDGHITEDNEISFVDYKEGAQTDMEGLAAFDSNGDGVLDEKDVAWRSFGILRDTNKNGIQDEAEFVSLDQMGIASIGLHREGAPHLNNGNVVFGTSEVVFSDGHKTEAADVMFAGEGIALPDAVAKALSDTPDDTSTVNRGEALNAPEAIVATRTVATTQTNVESVANVLPLPADLVSAPEIVTGVVDASHSLVNATSLDESAAIRQMAMVFTQAIATAESIEPPLAFVSSEIQTPGVLEDAVFVAAYQDTTSQGVASKQTETT